MADMAKSYGKWIIAAVVLFLAAVGGYLYWQSDSQKQASADSEATSAALDKVASGDKEGAERTDPAETRNDVTRPRYCLAGGAALRANDRKTAIDLYKQVEDDDGLPQPYRTLHWFAGR
jgi:hypothetical protein